LIRHDLLLYRVATLRAMIAPMALFAFFQSYALPNAPCQEKGELNKCICG
jgi:hypothetical protein